MSFFSFLNVPFFACVYLFFVWTLGALNSQQMANHQTGSSLYFFK